MDAQRLAIVVHHTDMDGWASAWVVNEWLKNQDLEVKFFSHNYGQTIDHIEIFIAQNKSRLSDIYLVDISLPDLFMQTYAAYITWLDHHVSAIEHVAELEAQGLVLKNHYAKSSIDGQRVAACELCWQTFHDEPMPKFVHWSGRYDVWDHREPEVLELNAYVNITFINSDENPPFLTPEFNALASAAGVLAACLEGRAALKWRDTFNRINSRRNAYVKCWTVAGNRIPIAIINAAGLDSYYFDTVFAKYPELKMAIFFHYSFRSNNWNISFRSLDPSYSSLETMQIALTEIYGADVISMGGHNGSCGATVSDIRPFLATIH